MARARAHPQQHRPTGRARGLQPAGFYRRRRAVRGRVGRGADQSYCILMTSFKLTADGRERIQTMVQTNDGFVIAETDLRLRGPGNIEGTQQSGMLRFLLADLARTLQLRYGPQAEARGLAAVRRRQRSWLQRRAGCGRGGSPSGTATASTGRCR